MFFKDLFLKHFKLFMSILLVDDEHLVRQCRADSGIQQILSSSELCRPSVPHLRCKRICLGVSSSVWARSSWALTTECFQPLYGSVEKKDRRSLLYIPIHCDSFVKIDAFLKEAPSYIWLMVHR